MSERPALLRRTGFMVTRDPRRVAAVLFLPGQELSAPGTSRAAGLVDRCLELPDDEVAATLADVRRDYGGRHADLDTLLAENFAAISHRPPLKEGPAPRVRAPFLVTSAGLGDAVRAAGSTDLVHHAARAQQPAAFHHDR